MTALDKYQRLEATGLWRETSEVQRREVIVSMGDASLTISDLQDRPLTHWSIAAIERANPNKRPAVFHPDADPSETLELGDNEAEMIEAIETQYMPVYLRPVFWLAGTDHTAAHMRPSYRWALRRGDKTALADDVEVMIKWRPRRVILAHGRWVPHDGVAALEHAFRKVLRARRWEVAYDAFEKGRGV